MIKNNNIKKIIRSRKMIELDDIQKQIMDNKKAKGFNTTNIQQEFCLLYGEVGEAFDAYFKKKEGLGLELADVAIYLMAISEMLGISLEKEVLKKIEINKNRVYERVNGVLLKKEK